MFPPCRGCHAHDCLHICMHTLVAWLEEGYVLCRPMLVFVYAYPGSLVIEDGYVYGGIAESWSPSIFQSVSWFFCVLSCLHCLDTQ